MIDPTDMEVAAIRSCLSPLGEFVGEMGMERPLANYSREEILTLIDVVVTAYQGYMLFEHEQLAAKDRGYFEEQLVRQQKAASAGGAL